MKFHNSKQGGFVGVLALLVVVAVLAGGGVYVYQKSNLETAGQRDQDVRISQEALPTEGNPDSSLKSPNNSVTTPGFVVFRIAANGSLEAVKDGKVLQAFTLSADGKSARDMIGSDDASFQYSADLNFDGYNDVGVLSGTGYAGVNTFYDFYLYNPKSETFEKHKDLTGISPVKVDAVNKQIVNTYKSGPGYVTETLTWTGSEYSKTAAKPVAEEKTSVSVDTSLKSYKNTELGFETLVHTKLSKPNIEKVDGNTVLRFNYPDQMIGGYPWYADITVFKVISSMSCSGDVFLGSFKNMNGLNVEERAFGDAGMRMDYYQIASGNSSYCVVAKTDASSMAGMDLVGITPDQASAQILKLKGEFQVMASAFVGRFNILK